MFFLNWNEFNFKNIKTTKCWWRWLYKDLHLQINDYSIGWLYFLKPALIHLEKYLLELLFWKN